MSGVAVCAAIVQERGELRAARAYLHEILHVQPLCVLHLVYMVTSHDLQVQTLYRRPKL